MNRIVMFVIALVFPAIFALEVNGQTVSTVSTIVEPAKTLPTVKEPVKEPKFSIALGMGNSYDFYDPSFSSDMNFKNSRTSSVRVGYALSKYIEIEGERSKINGFVWKRGDGYSWKAKSTVDFIVKSLNLKFGIPLKVKKVSLKPYFTLGIAGKNKLNIKVHGQDFDSSGAVIYNYDRSFSTTGKSSKIGMGINVGIERNFFLFLEKSRWKWKSNLDDGYVFKCSQTTGGVGLRF